MTDEEKANKSPYEPFGFDKKDLKSILISNNYCCPKCGTRPPNSDSYVVDEENYPQYYNEVLFSTYDGTIHDWDEVHRCTKCKTMFYYTNGCF